MGTFIKGMDVSSLRELEELGAKYYKDGREKDLLEILKEYGVNSIRLRLWNDPYSEAGVPYGAGTNDLIRLSAGSPLQRLLGGSRKTEDPEGMARHGCCRTGAGGL